MNIKELPERPVENSSKGSDPPHAGVWGKANLKRERLMDLLRIQYGYTNEKAIDELERLLKQFSMTNESLKFRRARRNSKPPFIE
jgi:hypothetical protein